MKNTITIMALAVFCFVSILLSTGFCDEKRDRFKGLWMEIWSDSSYNTTNFSTNTPPNPQENFYLSHLSIDAGFRFAIGDQLFVDPYVMMEQALDLGNESWNRVYWNNNYKIGPGIRLRYEHNDEKNSKGYFFWLKSMNVGPFIEYLYYGDSLDNSKDGCPDTVPDENWRTGISSWMSFDSKKEGRFGFWAELWAELTYNENNFYNKINNDFYLFLFQPKLGVEWKFDHIAVQPYLKCDLSYDFGNKRWNKEPWLNNLQYGPGVRLSLGNFKQIEGAVFHIYTEYLAMDYFSRVDRSSYADKASDDFRIGISFWLPFGVTKQSSIRK